MSFICSKYKEITEKVFRNIQNEIKIRDLQKHSEYELRHLLREEVEGILKQLNYKKPIYFEEEKIDILMGDIVVETKRFGSLKDGTRFLENAKKQIKEYMRKHLAPFGILTDLKKIYFFELDDNKNINEIKRKDDFDYDNFCYFLDIVIGERKKYISEKSLLADFGYVNNNSLIKESLKKLFSILTNSQNRKTKMIFSEWKKLFNLAETTNTEYLERRRRALEKYFDFEVDEKNEYQCIFVMHTLLSIIVKLVTFSFLMKLNNQQIKPVESIQDLKSFYINIESGEFFKSLGIINFCNNDFFSWYIHESWDDEIRDLLYHLRNRSLMYRYIDLEPISLKDALQKLYENFVPKEIRHSFGEYYTPSPVADYMVKTAEQLLSDKENYRAIDPTCGSGTFLVSLLKSKINKNIVQGKVQGKKIREIVNEVVGIDLNPIAVLMSKFNYLLVVYPYFKKEGDITDIEIPVYLGDSSYTPVEENIDGIPCIVYEYYFSKTLQIEFPKIVFPKSFVMSDKFLKVIMKIEEMIEQRENLQQIRRYVFKEIGEKNLNDKIKDHIGSLIQKVIEYHKKNLNTIWLYIFMNYLKPFALPKFDLIIGNPPWVRWAVLPYEYKEKIKKSLREEGIFSQDKNYGGVDLNVSALIAYRVVENLAKPGGILAFLFPQGILVNKSYEGFRKFIFGDKKGVPKLILKPIRSFFNEEPIIMFLEIENMDQ